MRRHVYGTGKRAMRSTDSESARLFRRKSRVMAVGPVFAQNALRIGEAPLHASVFEAAEMHAKGTRSGAA